MLNFKVILLRRVASGFNIQSVVVHLHVAKREREKDRDRTRKRVRGER